MYYNFILKDILYLLFIQVETVGDKYMAVSGLPEPCESHARCIARVALDMMDLSKQVKTQDMGGIVCHTHKVIIHYDDN